jgi:two-component system chemotaxis response regulator CheY
MHAETALAEIVKLPPVLDLRAAPAFLDGVRQRVMSGQTLRCDASAVETITLPCIQIILAAANSCESLTIRRPSPAFVAAFHDLGLELPSDLQDNVDDAVDTNSPEEMNEPQSIEDEQASDGVGQDASEPTDQPQTREATMTKRILTIDDSKTIRDMLMLTLSDAGFEVLQAVDGQDGVDMLTSERVDVIITDINMPRMNGYEVIRHLRADPEHNSTPILVLTTESTAEKKGMARDAGATGWMVKPFDPDQLIATVNRVSP